MEKYTSTLIQSTETRFIFIKNITDIINVYFFGWYKYKYEYKHAADNCIESNTWKRPPTVL